jgi:hypothetical protein
MTTDSHSAYTFNKRIGDNRRNQSNEVFQFGQNLAFPNGKSLYNI